MSAVNVTEPRYLLKQLATQPKFLWLEITKRCNLTCSHCYIESSPHLSLTSGMKLVDWKRTITQGAALGFRQLQFIGGEPLIYPGIENLIGFAQSEGFEFIEIYTNAMPITRERAALFGRLGIHIASSFYSADAETHDCITGYPGSHEKTLSSLERLVAYDVPVRVGFIEMERNLGEYEPTRRFLNKLGISRVGFDRIRPFGRGAKVSAASTQTRARSPYAGLCGQCGSGRLCVSNDGNVFPCIMSRSFLVGNVLSSSLHEILGGDLLTEFDQGMARSKVEEACIEACEPNGPCMVCGPGPGPCRPDGNCVPGLCFPELVCRPTHPPPCNPDICEPSTA